MCNVSLPTPVTYVSSGSPGQQFPLVVVRVFFGNTQRYRASSESQCHVHNLPSNVQETLGHRVVMSELETIEYIAHTNIYRALVFVELRSLLPVDKNENETMEEYGRR